MTNTALEAFASSSGKNGKSWAICVHWEHIETHEVSMKWVYPRPHAQRQKQGIGKSALRISAKGLEIDEEIGF